MQVLQKVGLCAVQVGQEKRAALRMSGTANVHVFVASLFAAFVQDFCMA